MPIDGTRYPSCFCGRLHRLVPGGIITACGAPGCAPPHRVQMSRMKGWRMPARTVSVARPTRWGNPFIVGTGQVEWDGPVEGTPGFYGRKDKVGNRLGLISFNGQLFDGLTADQAVYLYRAHMESAIMEDDTIDGDEDPDELRAALARLRGLHLACWCPLDQPCHADVLLGLANR